MNSSGIQNFLTHNVLQIAIMVVGLVLIFRAQNRDHKGALVTFGIVLIALAVLGLSTGNRALSVSNWISGLIFGR